MLLAKRFNTSVNDEYLLEGYFRIRMDEAGGFKILNGETVKRTSQ